MSNDDLKYQDSGIIGNIAASNAIWVETYGPRRKKGNVKKSASLRHVAPIDYNEGSNNEDEEEVLDLMRKASITNFIPIFQLLPIKKTKRQLKKDSLHPSRLLLPS